MNNTFITKLLSEKIVFSNLKDEKSLSAFDSIEWLAQNAKEKSILFYKVNEGGETQFLERIKDSKYGILILNKKIVGFEGEHIVVSDDYFLDAQKILCELIYPFHFNQIKLVGITGTNGKTTTTDLFRQIALQLNYKVLTIGTLGIKKNNKFISEEGLTTPGYLEFRQILFHHAKDVDVVCMEVSSHALAQDRIHKIKFDAVAWTSFSQDHLDYHKNLEEYFKAKCLIIENYLKPNAPCFVPSYEEELHFRLKKYPQIIKTRTLIERKFLDLPLFFSSQFNKSNLEVAWDLNLYLWKKEFEPNVFEFEMTEGRFSTFNIKDKIVIIDFAHTPDALENLCTATRHAFPQMKISLVFGCGGNRDKTKRPIMGKIAEESADQVFVTSDNPRFEKPEEIIKDITDGMAKKNHVVIVNREEAIKKAFASMSANEVLLIAGKGHENYQIINGVKHEYTDQAVVEKLKDL